MIARIDMRHIQQAKTSKYCGQACLAMLAGVELSEAIKAVGHRRATTKRQIIEAAPRLGLRPLTTLWQVDWPEVLPVLAICRMRHKGRRKGHWCCFVDGVFHDPLMPEAGQVGRNSLMTAYMEFDRVIDRLSECVETIDERIASLDKSAKVTRKTLSLEFTA